MLIFTKRLPEISTSIFSMVIHSVNLLKIKPSDNGNDDSFNDIGKFGYDRFCEVNASFMGYILLKIL